MHTAFCFVWVAAYISLHLGDITGHLHILRRQILLYMHVEYEVGGTRDVQVLFRQLLAKRTIPIRPVYEVHSLSCVTCPLQVSGTAVDDVVQTSALTLTLIELFDFRHRFHAPSRRAPQLSCTVPGSCTLSLLPGQAEKPISATQSSTR